MVHDHGDSNAGVPPVFEGAFTVNGVTHHISTSDNYLRNKQQLDPEIVDLTHSDAGLVIWRDSDVLQQHEEAALRLKRGLPPNVSPLHRPASCAHDSLTYNTDPLENPALRRPQQPSSWYDPFSMLDPYSPNISAYKRDDVAGNGMNTKLVFWLVAGVRCLISILVLPTTSEMDLDVLQARRSSTWASQPTARTPSDMGLKQTQPSRF